MLKTSSCFQGKSVLITGASSGIGEALAHEAAKQGAKLALGARRLDKLHQLSKGLPLQTTVFTDLLDVRNSQSIENFVQKSIQHLGSLDVVIANAGFGVVGSFEKLTIEDYQRQFETNVWGVMATLKSCLPFLKLSRGRIVIIGSVNSYVSFPGSSPYSMSKYSVRALAESLHHELSVYGISTTLICPGLVTSEIRQVDNQGVFHPEQPGRVPSWLVMDARIAAKKILKATYRRKRELVITFHGKLGVWVKSYLPSLFHFFVQKLQLRAGPHRAPKAQIE